MVDSSAERLAVTVSVDCAGWLAACPDAATAAEGAARAAITRQIGLSAVPPLVLDVTLTDDAEQRRLNQQWRGRNQPTNVLAFPASSAEMPHLPPGAPMLLGDVVLALETVQREAAEQQKPLGDHLRHLVVHGVLHLLGFNHQEPSAAQAMEAKEVEILKSLGVPDPYRDII